MEYVQERIATLHDLTGTSVGGGQTGTGVSDGKLPTEAGDLERCVGETAVVVPMTDREHKSPAAERVLAELETLAPAAVYVPVRAAPGRIEPFREWLESFTLPICVLWCGAPGVDSLLSEAGLAGEYGKGRDVWLALGPAAAAAETVVVHDADARSYEADHVRRLLAPLAMDAGFEFSKGYYARVERNQLFGRLFRLFYEPLVEVLATVHDEPILEYLSSFRYALAGEFAASADLARRLQAPRSWGLEVGTLGDAFDHAGFAGTAQVDLGRHVHDHRVVAGETGLEGMSRTVAAELLRVVEDRGVEPAYGSLPRRYLETGERLLAQYRADAAFNGLEYDVESERDQLARYADSISPPGPDRRLPPWTDAPFEPADVLEAARPWQDGRIETRSVD